MHPKRTYQSQEWRALCMAWHGMAWHVWRALCCAWHVMACDALMRDVWWVEVRGRCNLKRCRGEARAACVSVVECGVNPCTPCTLNPSSSTSSWFSVMRMYCWSLGLRVPPMASISSMNMMQGECFFAAVKRSRMRRAPTPTNTSSNSLPAWAWGGK